MNHTPADLDYRPSPAASTLLYYARKSVGEWIGTERDAWRAGRIPDDTVNYRQAREQLTWTREIAINAIAYEMETQCPNASHVQTRAQSLVDTYCDRQGQWEMIHRPGEAPPNDDPSLEEIQERAERRREADAQIPRHTWASDQIDAQGRVELAWDTTTVAEQPTPAQVRVVAHPKRHDRGETASPKINLAITDGDGRGTPVTIEGRAALELAAILATASERLR